MCLPLPLRSFRLDQELLFYALLLLTGLIAGVINTLAGGGSNLTIPALLLMGLPADMANATNRVGVLLQCVVGARGFRKAGKLPLDDAPGILGLSVAGGLAGALLASFLPNLYLKPVMLATMVGMALIILIRPSVVAPPPGTPARKVADYPASWPLLLVAGFYGGFVQAGVGFVLLGALAGALRYDLLRANALKLLCTIVFTTAALGVFIWRGQVAWVPGLVLAAGTMTGARFGVRWALQLSQETLKWFLFLMTLAACAAAMWS